MPFRDRPPVRDPLRDEPRPPAVEARLRVPLLRDEPVLAFPPRPAEPLRSDFDAPLRAPVDPPRVVRTPTLVPRLPRNVVVVTVVTVAARAVRRERPVFLRDVDDDPVRAFPADRLRPEPDDDDDRPRDEPPRFPDFFFAMS